MSNPYERLDYGIETEESQRSDTKCVKERENSNEWVSDEEYETDRNCRQQENTDQVANEDDLDGEVTVSIAQVSNDEEKEMTEMLRGNMIDWNKDEPPNVRYWDKNKEGT